MTKRDHDALAGTVSVSTNQLSALTANAATLARKRDHLLLHATPDEAIQRMVIAMCAGTYVRPHRHDVGRETLVLLDGELDVVVFDDHGTIVRRIALGQKRDDHARLVEIEPGTWHSVLCRTYTSRFFEVKPGPFVINETEFASWAPAEGDERVPAFVQFLAAAPVGVSAS